MSLFKLKKAELIALIERERERHNVDSASVHKYYNEQRDKMERRIHELESATVDDLRDAATAVRIYLESGLPRTALDLAPTDYARRAYENALDTLHSVLT